MTRRAAVFARISSPGVSLAVVLLGAACGSRTAPSAHEVEDAEEIPRAALPRVPGELGPALMEIAGDRSGLGAMLADVATCGTCHPDAFAQQQASAHAFSSFNNPIYRASVEPVRQQAGNRASRMCGGCHDIALMADGALDGEVGPDDRRAHAGVTCRTCHGIDAATRDGNGSYTLSATPISIPDLDDPASVEAHRKSAAPLREAEMCGSCHRAFLNEATGNGHFLSGQDDYGAWLGSPYNAAGLARVDDDIPKKTCIGCHMRREPAPLGDRAARGGSIASHRFVGGHTWLAQMIGDEAQLEAQRAMLRGAASIDIAAARDSSGALTLPADGAPLTPGAELSLDVVLRNRLVGHRFPGGVMDAQDTWVELTLVDARGSVVAASGGADDGGERHRLRALIAGADGEIRLRRETNQFSAVLANYTIAPRDMVAVRYTWSVPRDAARSALPTEARARLLHRSRNRELQDAACAATRSARGREFAATAKKLGDPVLDPCAPQPITVIAEVAIPLGRGAASSEPARPRWSRLYEHGMALLQARQEQAGEARPSLEAALRELEGQSGLERERAMVLTALGRLDARQGRTASAQARIAAARELAGPRPALAKIEGDALAAVWRWEQASAALAPATQKAGANVDGWRAYAIALGSTGRDREALRAAQAGLALSPRNPDLLRVQALALRALGSPEADRALEAYDHHRDPDVASELRFRSDLDPLPVIRLARAPR